MILHSKVFMSNRTQNVRLPAELRFPDDVKEVTVRMKGKERIITPLQNTWDSFFLTETSATDDFLVSRAEQVPTPRESFDD
ncbi:antitoxin [Providencia sp. PROV188]|mgnify:CR=1 FL=1|uniref:Antitoxin VapB n=2 Tax=Providencia TaxID=586 RepID=A0A4R3NJB3_9GAMM|nr:MULTISPECIES: type II toxin-antitoxin system VapB family antitoxin [Providencia]MTC73571.1 AbrB/MazE/SpoVT family DNA-binding domain-containing protein [Providencia sp. wls1919]ETT02858.1 toxin-antitoxin system, antitoxin component, AbrB family [Providencia alcalifaciens PAL-3]EUD01385.1 toxin-antitoxin system, antitoxin component, AbrB family [Providencia alcalifaciens PAL-1]MDR2243156.1 antitoxin [Providencia alcalifaciens]MDR2989945.1 antitoxin [Providencia alcalifaciens]